MIYQCTHAFVKASGNEDAITRLQYAGAMLGLNWINNSKSAVTGIVPNIIMFGTLAYQHTIVERF